MRRSYTKGVRGLIIFTIFLMFISFSMTKSALRDYKDVKTLYQEDQDERFDGKSGYSIIKVLGIQELDLEDESLENGEKYYMIESENAFLVLKSTQGDLKKIIGDDRLSEGIKLKRFLSDERYARIHVTPEKSRSRRSGTKINISQELKMKFEQEANKNVLIMLSTGDIFDKYNDNEVVMQKIKEKPFYSNVYITPTGIGYYVLTTGISTIVLISTILTLITVVKRIRRAKGNYENMFITYPEVERDLDKLLSDASYINKNLKILVYKNSIIVYKGVFEFVELNNIKNVSFMPIRSKGSITGYAINIKRNNGVASYDIKISNSKSKNIEDIRKLQKYLETEHSIKVNYNMGY